MPFGMAYMESVPYGDTFAIVGGRVSSSYFREIFIYDPVTPGWTEVVLRLSEEKGGVAAFPVKKAIFPPCT